VALRRKDTKRAKELQDHIDGLMKRKNRRNADDAQNRGKRTYRAPEDDMDTSA